MKNNDSALLSKWSEKLEKSLSAYNAELQKMAQREAQYNGDRDIRPLTGNDTPKNGKKRKAAHVWNITAENIEAEIDSSIPMPKVTPKRKKDERLARVIENMLRNELDRLPTEKLNDIAERTAKKQGGVGLLAEWDSTKRTHTTVGENVLQIVHPSRIIPPDGTEDIDDAEFFFLLLPSSKAAVKERYGVDMSTQNEEKPELRGNAASSEEMVTLKICFYKNKEGGIGRFAWVNDTVCENLPDAQARCLRRCKKCGQTQRENAFALDMPTIDGTFPPEAGKRKPRKDECAYCGSRSWESTEEESRSVPLSDLKRLGVRQDVIDALMADAIPPTQAGAMPQTPQGDGLVPQSPAPMLPDMTELTVDIPYYKPNLFPLVIMKNISAHTKFLGESDCDKVKDQQNTMNRLNQKILDRLIKAGTKITAPPDARFTLDAEDNEMIRVTNLTDIALVKEFQFSGDLQYEFMLRAEVYSEAQRLLGITESFLGRKDATAQSGTAKEFAASQTAGRLESKRVLKKLAWSQLFERVFKNMLAYSDEKRPVRFRSEEGETDYEEFNPYEFLEIDDAGELYWNDEFIFSCDDASGLAANREAMWRECTAQMQSGAFGNPTELSALIIYWAMMEDLHYPGAGNTKKLLQEQQNKQMQQQAIMMQMQAAQGQAMPKQTAAPTQAAMPPTIEGM